MSGMRERAARALAGRDRDMADRPITWDLWDERERDEWRKDVDAVLAVAADGIDAWRAEQFADGVLVAGAWSDGVRYGLAAAIDIIRGDS